MSELEYTYKHCTAMPFVHFVMRLLLTSQNVHHKQYFSGTFISTLKLE